MPYTNDWVYLEGHEVTDSFEELPDDGEITDQDIEALEELVSGPDPEPIETLELITSDPAEIIESSTNLLAEAGVTYQQPSADLDTVDVEVLEADPEIMIEAGAALATVGSAILVAAPWVLGATGISLLTIGGYRMVRNDIKKRPERWQIANYTKYFRSDNRDKTNPTPSRQADCSTADKPRSWELITEHPCPGYYAKSC
jgi:hypothetical protein